MMDLVVSRGYEWMVWTTVRGGRGERMSRTMSLGLDQVQVLLVLCRHRQCQMYDMSVLRILRKGRFNENIEVSSLNRQNGKKHVQQIGIYASIFR